MKKEFYFKPPSATENAYIDESDLPDRKVGSIVIYTLDDNAKDQQAIAERQRCYVYRSRDLGNRLYYFTHMGTRVFVVDEKKVDFFPNGVEPDGPEGRSDIKDFSPIIIKQTPCLGAAPFNAWQAARENEKLQQELKRRGQKIGCIVVQQFKEKDGSGGIEISKRDVFCSDVAFCGEPFFFTHNGSRILVMDRKKIQYDTMNDSRPGDKGLSEAALFQKAKLEIESGLRESFGTDAALGTIVVRVADAESENGFKKVVRQVFGSPPNEDGTHGAVRPYMVGTDGHAIIVNDASSIRYFPRWLKPKSSPKLVDQPEVLMNDDTAMKIGNIDIAVGKHASSIDEMGDGKTTVSYDVYACKRKYGGQPFYTSHNGCTVMIIDKKKIKYAED